MTFDYESFSADNVEPFSFKDIDSLNGTERHAIAMREAIETINLTGENGQIFSALYLNRDFGSKIAIISLGAYLNDVNSPELKYKGYQYAAANPENPILIVDVPAHGNSDSLTSIQRREILRTKGVFGVASSQAEAARRRLNETNEIIVVGESAGGRLAPDFTIKAAEIGLKPLALAGFDIAGIDKRASIGSVLAFFVDGHLSQSKYHQGQANKNLDRAFNAFKTELIKFGYEGVGYSLAQILKKEPIYIAFLFGRSPLASDSGFAAIEKGMDLNSDMVAAFVSAGLSKVSRWHKIKPHVNELRSLYVDRLSWDVWPFDSHSMSIAPQQPRFAALTRAMIDLL